ncbi:uncharacterized protein si:dkey-106l3.7 isoform X2 [Xiphias gladius]|uniref:uncharacterized protein si:dkey-106l3.7 isoform X2 n=1 Tax=Xiphias gladius TaxID=8245 RepID=UPI001A99AAAC|nr:uncharacterized protein si:dkey-106l3.7 isoform X2 [Xiphias gladius]
MLLPLAQSFQQLRCEGQRHLEMNLYRSFGNLMEAWVTEGRLYSDTVSLRNNNEDSPTSSSDMGTNLRSESVDSGVETASSDTLFPATSCLVSADNAEIDAFIPEREVDGLTPASTSQSPVLSSPVPSSSSSASLHLCPSRPQEGSAALHLKVEQALQRTDSKHQKDNPEPLTVEEVLRRQPRASSLHKWHKPELVRGQRSKSFGLRRTANPSVSVRQMSEKCRQPMSMNCDKQRSAELGEEESTGLSPGLNYLEQVCQMLEGIARQQMHNRALRMEMDALREHQDAQAPHICQRDSKAAGEDLSLCQRLENIENAEHNSSEPQQQKDNSYRHFRQRSASDTTIATLHLRKMKSDCRGQHLSINDLLEKTEEDHEKEDSEKEESNKSNKNWKIKIGSLRRVGSSLRNTEGQQMQSCEKKSTQRRLSQLFRRKTKNLPV